MPRSAWIQLRRRVKTTCGNINANVWKSKLDHCNVELICFVLHNRIVYIKLFTSKCRFAVISYAPNLTTQVRIEPFQVLVLCAEPGTTCVRNLANKSRFRIDHWSWSSQTLFKNGNNCEALALYAWLSYEQIECLSDFFCSSSYSKDDYNQPDTQCNLSMVRTLLRCTCLLMWRALIIWRICFLIIYQLEVWGIILTISR